MTMLRNLGLAPALTGIIGKPASGARSSGSAVAFEGTLTSVLESTRAQAQADIAPSSKRGDGKGIHEVEAKALGGKTPMSKRSGGGAGIHVTETHAPGGNTPTALRHGDDEAAIDVVETHAPHAKRTLTTQRNAEAAGALMGTHAPQEDPTSTAERSIDEDPPIAVVEAHAPQAKLTPTTKRGDEDDALIAVGEAHVPHADITQTTKPAVDVEALSDLIVTHAPHVKTTATAERNIHDDATIAVGAAHVPHTTLMPTSKRSAEPVIELIVTHAPQVKPTPSVKRTGDVEALSDLIITHAQQVKPTPARSDAGIDLPDASVDASGEGELDIARAHAAAEREMRRTDGAPSLRDAVLAADAMGPSVVPPSNSAALASAPRAAREGPTAQASPMEHARRVPLAGRAQRSEALPLTDDLARAAARVERTSTHAGGRASAFQAIADAHVQHQGKLARHEMTAPVRTGEDLSLANAVQAQLGGERLERLERKTSKEILEPASTSAALLLAPSTAVETAAPVPVLERAHAAVFQTDALLHGAVAADGARVVVDVGGETLQLMVRINQGAVDVRLAGAATPDDLERGLRASLLGEGLRLGSFDRHDSHGSRDDSARDEESQDERSIAPSRPRVRDAASNAPLARGARLSVRV